VLERNQVSVKEQGSAGDLGGRFGLAQAASQFQRPVTKDLLIEGIASLHRAQEGIFICMNGGDSQPVKSLAVERNGQVERFCL